jgi:hypothetical protein
VIENHPYPMEVFEIIKKERPARPPRNDRHASQKKPKPTTDQKVGAAKKKGKKTWFGKKDRY